MTKKVVPVRTFDDDRIDELRVVRYSDVAGQDGMDGMVLRLWEIETGAEFDRSLRTLGTRPLDEPELVRNGAAASIPKCNTRYVTFDAGHGVKALYVFGSAIAANSEDGDNEFTKIFCRVIDQWRPRLVVLPEFGRLVRKLDHAGQIWRALESNVTTLIDAESRLGIQEPDAEMRFTFKVLQASSDASIVKTRLLNGLLNAVERGESPLAAYQMPFGYVKRDDGQVEIRVADKPIIEAIVTGVAAGDPPARIVENVGRLGASTPGIRRLYGPNATVADCSNKPGMVDRWMGWLDLWETGKTEQARKSPYLRQETYRGFEIRKTDKRGEAYLIIPIDWGVPEGGWVPQDVIHVCRTRRSERTVRPKSKGGTDHAMRQPLSGISSWSDELHDWYLFSDVPFYELRRRKIGSSHRAASGWGNRPNLDGEKVVRIKASVLHRSIADTIADVIAGGVSGEHVDALAALNLRSAARSDNIAASAAAELREVTAQQDRLIDSLAHTSKAQVREKIAGQADDLEQRIAKLRDVVDAQADPREVESDALLIIEAFARLANADGTTDARLGDALRAVIQDLRFCRGGDKLEWTMGLLIPTHTGTLRLGPITGTVPCYTKKRYPSSLADRVGDVAKALLTTDATLQDVTTMGDGRRRKNAEGVIHKYLEDLGLSRAVRTLFVNGHVPTSATRVVWNHLKGARTDEGHDPEWVTLVTDTYLDGNVLPNSTVFGRHLTMKRGIAAHLLSAGGSAPEQRLVTSSVATAVQVSAAVKGRVRPGAKRDTQPIVQRDKRRPDSHISLIPCPHCDGWASQVHALPEVTAGIICTTCMKMPTQDSPTFPDDYVVT